MKGILILLLFSLHVACFGQVPPDSTKLEPAFMEFDGIDETGAMFPGGDFAMFNFIKESIIYPEDAKKNKESGRVYVGFSIEADGSVSDVKVERGVSESLDAEALRIMKSMPKFEPATIEGKAVKTYVRMPIVFTLD